MTKNRFSKKGQISSFPRDALEQAEIVMNGWNEVGKRLNVPNLTMQNYIDKFEEVKKSLEKAEQLKLQRAKAIQARNNCLGELWDLTKRIRNAAKATFGDYSRELDILINSVRELDSRDIDVDENP